MKKNALFLNNCTKRTKNPGMVGTIPHVIIAIGTIVVERVQEPMSVVR